MYGGGGKREIIYLSLRCHRQNDSCVKMGSDVNQFNVSLIVRDKVTRQCPQTTTFEEKGESKQIRTEVPLLTSLTPYRWAKPAHNLKNLRRSCVLDSVTWLLHVWCLVTLLPSRCTFRGVHATDTNAPVYSVVQNHMLIRWVSNCIS